MQTVPPEDFFDKSPLTDDKVEFGYEKVVFNKKDRYMNSDKRIQAMKALLLGPFIHGEAAGIVKAVKYVAAVAQTTTNSTEKAQILALLDICPIMLNVLYAARNGIFQIEFS